MLKSHHVTLCLILLLSNIYEVDLFPYKASRKIYLMVTLKDNLVQKNMNGSALTTMGRHEVKDKQIAKEINILQNDKQNRNYELKNFKMNLKIFSKANTLAYNDGSSMSIETTQKSLGFNTNRCKDDNKKAYYLKNTEWHEQRLTNIQGPKKPSSQNNASDFEKFNIESKHERNAQNPERVQMIGTVDFVKKINDTLLLEKALLKNKFKKHRGDLYFKKDLVSKAPEHNDAIHRDYRTPAQDNSELVLRNKNQMEGNVPPGVYKNNKNVSGDNNDLRDNLQSTSIVRPLKKIFDRYEGNKENDLILNNATKQVETSNITNFNDRAVKFSYGNLKKIKKDNNETLDESAELKNNLPSIDKPWFRRQLRRRHKKFNPKIALRETVPQSKRDYARESLPRDKTRHTVGKAILEKGKGIIIAQDNTRLGGIDQTDRTGNHQIVQSLDFVVHAPRTDVDDDHMDLIDSGFSHEYQNMDSGYSSTRTKPLESDISQDYLTKNMNEASRTFTDTVKCSDPEKIASFAMKHKIKSKNTDKGHSKSYKIEENENHFLKRPQIVKLMDLVDSLPEGVIIITKPRKLTENLDTNSARIDNTLAKETRVVEYSDTKAGTPDSEKEQKIKQKSDDNLDLRNSWRNKMNQDRDGNQIDRIGKQYDRSTPNQSDSSNSNNVVAIEDTKNRKHLDQNEQGDNHKLKYADILRGDKDHQTVGRWNDHDRELDETNSGDVAWTKSNSDGSRGKLGVGCVKLLYDGASKASEVKSGRFCPKFMARNPVTTLFLKFRWITTTEKSHLDLNHCQCCPKRYQKQ